MQELGRFNLKINVVPNRLEKYMSFFTRPSQIGCTVTTMHVTYRQTALGVHENSCTLLIPLCKNNLNLPIHHKDYYALRK